MITFGRTIPLFIGLYGGIGFSVLTQNVIVMRRIIFLVFLFCALYSPAQNVDFQNCYKYTEANLSKYVHSLGVFPEKIPGTDMFWYCYVTSDGVKYFLVDPAKKSKTEMFSVADMVGRLTQATGLTFNTRDFRLGGLKFDEGNPYRFSFSKGGKDFHFDIRTQELREVENDTPCRFYPEGQPYWLRFSPDSNFMVYAWHHNLYLLNRNDTVPVQLTTDGEKFYSYSTQRDKDSEQKTTPNIVWAGNSRVFYSLRQDRRKVEDCWVINSLSQPRPKLITYKFPMPGDKYVFTYDLHLFHPETRQHLVVNIDKYPDQEVKIVESDLSGNPDDLYFTRKSRTCDKMDLCRVDTRTGEVFEVISETSIPYFTEQLFDCRILNDGEDIIWWSERTGWGQYYLYNKSGKLKNVITSGSFVACRLSHLDRAKRYFIFEGYGREKGTDPDYRLYYRVNFDGTGLTLLTPGNAYHSIDLSGNRRYVLDVFSRADQAPVSIVRDMKGKEVMRLEEADLSLLYGAGWKAPKRISVKATDGITDLYGVMYMPFHMDTTKKYPVITYVYPGPQEDQVPLAFAIDDNGNQSLAQLGFIVIHLGYRGSSMFRGKSFYNFGYGNLRDYALADSKFAIEQLADRFPFLDLNRVGIYGHSGGGFMAAAAILTYPDFYKVAVSASGNHDNNIYTKWWGEMYHGVKMRTEKGNNGEKNYTFESKIPTTMELAKNLKGKLLLITGDMDINVHPANTFRLADALIKAGKRFDMMVIPGADHGLESPYYYNLIRYYFVEHLLGQEVKSTN